MGHRASGYRTIGVAALAVALGGVALWGQTGVRPGSDRGQTPSSFDRTVAPFKVIDAAGHEYALPFLGGLDVPRPQFVDIDADGDLDLFVQEYQNAIWFLENTGTLAAPRYEWRTSQYQGLETGEWYRFVDIDADGDVDLLAEQPFSNIRLYRNTGTKTVAKFGSAEVVRDADGAPMFLDRQNIPAIVDLDCDGRLDFFIGRIEGHVARYEATAPGSERFGLIEDHYEGIEIIGRGGGPGPAPPRPIGTQVRGTRYAGTTNALSLVNIFQKDLSEEDDKRLSLVPGTRVPRTTYPRTDGAPLVRHGANALAFADFDGDKDLDLFWGDFFEAGVLLIENIGPTCSTPSFQVDPVLLPYADSRTSGYNAPAPVDLDRDGDLDFLMGVIGGSFNPVRTAADNFYHWARTAPDRFELKTTRFLDAIDLGSESMPAAGDLDGDGDLDLVVGSKVDPATGDAGRLTLFYNEGTAAAPVFRQQAATKIVDAYHLAPALGDLDGDGDLDLLVGTWNQDVRFFRNQGTRQAPKWVEEPDAAIRPPRASMSAPALADLDGDKDLDLLVGQATGAIVFYRNDGSVKSPKFTLVSERIDDLRPGRRASPALVDLDGDGLLDLVAGRETGGVAVYRNNGTRAAPKFVERDGLALPLPPSSSPVFADLDGDKRLDVLSGTASGGLVFLKGS